MKIHTENSDHVWTVRKFVQAPIESDDDDDHLFNGKPYETFQTVDSPFKTIGPTNFDPQHFPTRIVSTPIERTCPSTVA
jgi:hypothetical protein